MTDADVLVVGGGPNGLTTAALLARAGRRVMLIERRPFVGGLAASEEFHPGYRSAGLLHDSTGVRPGVISELELARHGLVVRSERPSVLALGEVGSALVLHADPRRTAAELERRSGKDAPRYLELRAFLDRVRGVLSDFLDRPPLDLLGSEPTRYGDLLSRGLRLRRLGRSTMMELLRLPPMAVADWLDEWFEDDLLKAALGLPAVAGTFLGPRSPGSNLNLLLWEAAAGPGVTGDGPGLVEALERAARQAGVEIRTGARVERIVVEGGAVRGLIAAGGERIDAPVVAASCDPKQTLLELVGPEAISGRLARRAGQMRTRGTTARVLLAMSAPPRFAAGADGPVERATIAGSLDGIEHAFDAIKYDAIAEQPILEVHVPSIAAPDLAPAGGAVVSVLVHYAPYAPRSGWDDASRARLADLAISRLELHAPGSAAAVVASEVTGPADIEARYGLSGGQVHHLEHALDQRLVRPTPECVHYRTPVKGLYLCGGGSHPGGGLTCAPGRLAARAILDGERP